jgi:hypothetical protein
MMCPLAQRQRCMIAPFTAFSLSNVKPMRNCHSLISVASVRVDRFEVLASSCVKIIELISET